jgi:hypothetical protein
MFLKFIFLNLISKKEQNINPTNFFCKKINLKILMIEIDSSHKTRFFSPIYVMTNKLINIPI